MRVLCVDDKNQHPFTHQVEEGEVYNAVDEIECPCGECKEMVYELEEYPFDLLGNKCYYWVKRFVPYEPIMDEIETVLNSNMVTVICEY